MYFPEPVLRTGTQCSVGCDAGVPVLIQREVQICNSDESPLDVSRTDRVVRFPVPLRTIRALEITGYYQPYPGGGIADYAGPVRGDPD